MQYLKMSIKKESDENIANKSFSLQVLNTVSVSQLFPPVAFPFSTQCFYGL